MSVPTPTPSVNGTRRRRFCANRQYPWTVPGATDEADLRGATDEADLTTPVQAETSLPPPSPFMDRADRGATTNDAVAEEAALRCMMRMLLRSPELLAGVRTVLTTRDIERDSSYSLVWAVLFQTALDLTDQYGAPPSREVLTAEATLRIERAPELAGIPVAAALAEELEHVYSGEVTEADVAFGRNVVQLHLRRRTETELFEKLEQYREYGAEIDGDGASTSSDRITAATERLAEIEALGSTAQVAPTVAEFLEAAENQRWLATGALPAGQPIVVAGPVKARKTALACEIAVGLATRTSVLGRYRLDDQRPGACCCCRARAELPPSAACCGGSSGRGASPRRPSRTGSGSNACRRTSPTARAGCRRSSAATGPRSSSSTPPTS